MSERQWKQGVEEDVVYFEMSIEALETAWALSPEDKQKKNQYGRPEETKTFELSIGFADARQFELFQGMANNGNEGNAGNEGNEGNVGNEGSSVIDAAKTQGLEGHPASFCGQGFCETVLLTTMAPEEEPRETPREKTPREKPRDGTAAGAASSASSAKNIYVRRGDVVGCGWDRKKQWMYVTINGRRIRGRPLMGTALMGTGDRTLCPGFSIGHWGTTMLRLAGERKREGCGLISLLLLDFCCWILLLIFVVVVARRRWRRCCGQSTRPHQRWRGGTRVRLPPSKSHRCSESRPVVPHLFPLFPSPVFVHGQRSRAVEFWAESLCMPGVVGGLLGG